MGNSLKLAYCPSFKAGPILDGVGKGRSPVRFIVSGSVHSIHSYFSCWQLSPGLEVRESQKWRGLFLIGALFCASNCLTGHLPHFGEIFFSYILLCPQMETGFFFYLTGFLTISYFCIRYIFTIGYVIGIWLSKLFIEHNFAKVMHFIFYLSFPEWPGPAGLLCWQRRIYMSSLQAVCKQRPSLFSG